jgi:hypothetical protein
MVAMLFVRVEVDENRNRFCCMVDAVMGLWMLILLGVQVKSARSISLSHISVCVAMSCIFISFARHVIDGECCGSLVVAEASGTS